MPQGHAPQGTSPPHGPGEPSYYVTIAAELTRIYAALDRAREDHRYMREEIMARFDKADMRLQETERIAAANARKLAVWTGILRVLSWAWAGVTAALLTYSRTIYDALMGK